MALYLTFPYSLWLEPYSQVPASLPAPSTVLSKRKRRPAAPSPALLALTQHLFELIQGIERLKRRQLLHL